MNYQEIEKLKAVLTKMMKRLYAYDSGLWSRRKNCKYWIQALLDKSGDSKIEKLEINFVDNRGRVVPLCIYSIIGYEIVSLREEVWKMRKYQS